MSPNDLAPIPVANPKAGIETQSSEILRAVEAVIESGQYILGPQVERFEEAWAARCGSQYAVGVSSGTDALALALSAAGVQAGDEVIVPAMTALATWTAVSQIGAIPIGADIESEGFCIDPDQVALKITDRTRAIVVVHLFGQVAAVNQLAELAQAHDIPLIEDAAQAHGAQFGGRTVGSLSTAASFSFYPTKNLGALGDAGAVTTDDPEVADRVRRLRQYGWRERTDAEIKGYSARLDELQAALLLVRLNAFEASSKRRAAIAEKYLAGLSDLAELKLPQIRAQTVPVWHQFVVAHPRREQLAEFMNAAGVGTSVQYVPPHMHSSYLADGWQLGDFPVAEHHARTALSLPCYPELSDNQVESVTAAIREFCTT